MMPYTQLAELGVASSAEMRFGPEPFSWSTSINRTQAQSVSETQEIGEAA
jgi:hypothetical protein